ncbi:hypothetical protein I312_104248 [Cryptococcus bacillisporus CA1280]|uniref:Palmitoyltransferase n=1 Tax=Cryptococcus bacillisporus CA1280 TaxID=1296109 RepID=A0A0D0TKJ0_CRYGA|nr:vacuolar protein [Cryptococcus bacillisporus CA1280]
MSLIHNCSGVVIRCFKHVEHFADWLTGAAGPVFVFLCWLLIGSGGVLFFDVVARGLSLLSLLLLSPLLVLVPLNLYLQYYLATHVPPGFPAPRASGPDKNMSWIVPDTKSIWAPERWGFKKMTRPLTGSRQAEGTAETGRRVRRCRKCDGPKPERTHHCSVCKRCVLMMDHHCPWINNCVGLHNQRHFVLFMAWLSIGCWVTAVLGYHRFLDTFKYRSEWNSWTPKLGWTIIWVLAVAIGVAVPILTLWHLYMVSNGETSIESHDNAYLASKAKSEGLIYLNPYDLGRRRNLQLFFNLGPGGYSPTTLLFPFLVPPATNGWSFYRRPLPTHPLASMKELHAPELGEGLIARTNASSGRGLGLGLGLDVGDSVGSHAEDGLGGYVMGDDGSLTDDEEGGGGYID